MSTLPDPYAEGSRADQPLSARERAVLDDIAGHENAGDPGFVTRLGQAGAGGDGRLGTRLEVLARARRRDLAIQGAVVAGLAALLLPAAWFVAAVVTLVLLVVPLLLVVQACREAHGTRERGDPRHGPAGPAD